MGSRTRIKICGISQPDDALTAARAGADAIGLVFVQRSPRCVSVERACEIVQTLPAFVEPVGLFMDHPAEQIASIAQAVGLRTVQLHGSQTPQLAEQLPAHLRIIKAIAFNEHASPTLSAWAGLPRLAAVLFDAPPAPDAALTGGSGRTFDWPGLADMLAQNDNQPTPPLILAGGLTPENVQQAIATVRPWAVDVSSGVERQRGVKDAQRIAAFCHAAQQADERTDAL